MFSSIIYREEDSIDEFISLGSMIKEYIAYDLGKHFNMSIDDYLSLTFFSKRYLIDAAVYKDKKMRKQLAEYEKEKRSKELNNGEKLLNQLDLDQFE